MEKIVGCRYENSGGFTLCVTCPYKENETGCKSIRDNFQIVLIREEEEKEG